MRMSAAGFVVIAMMACSETPVAEPEPKPAKSEPAKSEPEPPPEPEPTPVADPDPPPAVFDPDAPTSIDARIVGLFATKSWHACGYSHSVGAIEVEVQGFGTPAPRLLLVISCPVDSGMRKSLSIGAMIHAELHAKKQSWPSPAGKLPDLPRRYVESIAQTPGGSTSSSASSTGQGAR